jgi:hypothetical protein
MDKVQLIIVVLVCLQSVLSAVGILVKGLGKQEIPFLSKAALVLGKIIDIVQGNVQH